MSCFSSMNERTRFSRQVIILAFYLAVTTPGAVVVSVAYGSLRTTESKRGHCLGHVHK